MYVRTWHVPWGGGGDNPGGAWGLGIVEALSTNGEFQAVSSGDGRLRDAVLLKAVKAVLRAQYSSLMCVCVCVCVGGEGVSIVCQ